MLILSLVSKICDLFVSQLDFERIKKKSLILPTQINIHFIFKMCLFFENHTINLTIQTKQVSKTASTF